MKFYYKRILLFNNCYINIQFMNSFYFTILKNKLNHIFNMEKYNYIFFNFLFEMFWK